jgi:hypothetical protein
MIMLIGTVRAPGAPTSASPKRSLAQGLRSTSSRRLGQKGPLALGSLKLVG